MVATTSPIEVRLLENPLLDQADRHAIHQFCDLDGDLKAFQQWWGAEFPTILAFFRRPEIKAELEEYLALTAETTSVKLSRALDVAIDELVRVIDSCPAEDLNTGRQAANSLIRLSRQTTQRTKGTQPDREHARSALSPRQSLDPPSRTHHPISPRPSARVSGRTVDSHGACPVMADPSSPQARGAGAHSPFDNSNTANADPTGRTNHTDLAPSVPNAGIGSVQDTSELASAAPASPPLSSSPWEARTPAVTPSPNDSDPSHSASLNHHMTTAPVPPRDYRVARTDEPASLDDIAVFELGGSRSLARFKRTSADQDDDENGEHGADEEIDEDEYFEITDTDEPLPSSPDAALASSPFTKKFQTQDSSLDLTLNDILFDNPLVSIIDVLPPRTPVLALLSKVGRANLPPPGWRPNFSSD